MNIENFISNARMATASIAGESGSFLYSAANTLRKGDFYFLGLNPGGNAGTQTIDAAFGDLIKNSENNAYLDEEWESEKKQYEKGKHPLQKNAKTLFDDVLKVELRNVCSSNLIFIQSSEEGGSGYPKNADICWPVHEMIFNIVQPKVVITFGRQPFDYIANKYSAKEFEEKLAGHGKWKCRTEIATYEAEALPFKLQFRLIGLPHLSRYHINKDISSWIKKLVDAQFKRVL